jgi:hypothetical protein
MRFVLGPIPVDPAPTARPGWTRAKEPPLWLVTWILAWPVAAVLSAGAGFAVGRLTPIAGDGLNLPALLALAVVLVVAHELVHAGFHPRCGLSRKTILGFWPSRWIVFAHYCGPRSKARFLAGMLGPLIVLSVVPIVLASLFGLTWWGLGALAIINAAVSCGDAIGFVVVLFGVPADTLVQNSGWQTYWRSGP